MESDVLGRLLRRIADSMHHFTAGDDGSHKFPAARANLLRYSKAGRSQRCARMYAGARLHQTIHLESVRERAVCKRCERCVYFLLSAENAALAAFAVLRRVIDNDLAPRQRTAISARADGIDDARFGAVDNVCGYAVVLELRCEFSQSLCGGCHVCSSFSITTSVDFRTRLPDYLRPLRQFRLDEIRKLLGRVLGCSIIARALQPLHDFRLLERAHRFSIDLRNNSTRRP